MNEPPVELGRELRRRREAAGLSQKAFAAQIHYSKGHLSKVENGRVRANQGFAEACDRALDTSGVLRALVDAAPAGVAQRWPVTGFSGLPAVTRHFTGRTGELATIHDALTSEQAMALVCVLGGMAGVGKTTLALRAAWHAENRFPDGCLFLDLHGHTLGSAEIDSREALGRLLLLLGVPSENTPRDTDGRANLYRDRLRGRRMLLVFDNVRSAGQVIPLLPAEPRCRVLITSRYRLNALDDAVHVAVDVLTPPQAAELFRSIAGPRAPLADDVVADVVEHCGRLPLAVRIAAARFAGNPLWTIEEFAARLADEAARLGALDDGERSVAAAFHLSYQGLPDDQRRLFGLLALHPGRDIAVRSAAALAGIGLTDAERLLNRLGDAHLTIRVAGGYTRFHDLVRVFAVAHALPAVPADDQDAAVRRLLDFALCQAAAGDQLLAPQRYRPELTLADLPPIEPGFADRDAALAWWDTEWPNLVALCDLASARSRHTQCWQLAFLLREFFFRAKLWEPWIDTHRVAVGSARAVGDGRALAMTLNNLGMAHVDRGDLADARDLYAEALTLFGAAGDEYGTIGTQTYLAWVDLYLGDTESALRHLEVALESYRRTGSARNAAITLRGIALAETALGRFAVALDHAEQAYAEVEELGLDLDMTMGRNCVAWVHFRAGRLDAAAEHYVQAAELAEHSGSRHELARALTGLGNVAARRGEHAAADESWTRAAELHGGLNPIMVGEADVRRALGQDNDVSERN
jgi:tetratricopeptide (TPR) repeat protein/DNA-binding XRE family transcriptional regulator